MATRTCVVVCYYIGEPIGPLFRLLKQMGKVDPGAPFDVVIVVNGGDLKPLTLPPQFAGLRARVINRVNHGYNIEAWDIGWRASEGYDYFLFLQSQCFLKAKNWISDFEFRMARDRGVGLLGELYFWEHKTWEFIRESTDRDLGPSIWPAGEPLHPVEAVKTFIEGHGLPATELGTHLSAIILFTSRAVLEEVGGFPLVGATYRQATAGEVGFSRVIEAKGYRLSRIRDRDFSVIGHRQHTRAHQVKDRLMNNARSFLKKLGVRRPRRKKPAVAPPGAG
ncbi:hypothetical protein TA3x_002326 [Tundrisphaera sp. TA3]|uniref:hypothetical protein n=1 Tax=Tundrisphaera sp. TA3 TaxID=3435775 RepID=UPI003EBA3F2F